MNWSRELTELKSKKTNKIITTILLIILFSFLIFNNGASTFILIISLFGLLVIGIQIYEVIKMNKLIKKYKRLIEIEKEKQKQTYSNFNGSFEDFVNKIFEDFINNHSYTGNIPNFHFPNQKLDNAYKLLKINRTDSIEIIKKTYKQLALKWHPDKWTTDTKENQEIALRNFKKLQAAYELIKKDKNIV